MFFLKTGFVCLFLKMPDDVDIATSPSAPALPNVVVQSDSPSVSSPGTRIAGSKRRVNNNNNIDTDGEVQPPPTLRRSTRRRQTNSINDDDDDNNDNVTNGNDKGLFHQPKPGDSAILQDCGVLPSE